MGSAGERLRRLRVRLGITTREVEYISRKIADEEGEQEFVVSHARLVQIETGESTPSLYKLYTLSSIYGVNITELLSYYVELERINHHHIKANLQNTHLIMAEAPDPQQRVNFPVRFDPGFSIDRTNLLSRMVEVWGEVPIALIQHLDIRKSCYGFIGLSDYTMYPLLRPGSLVQIDDRQKALPPGMSRTEFERPIYFIELRSGYICSWCELHRNRLVVVPHPLSPCRTQEFAYPTEAEIVGRVTAVAARLTPLPEPLDSSPGPSRLPKQS